MEQGVTEGQLPTLKEILGAMVFAVNRPLSVREMRKCLVETADAVGGTLGAFADVKETDVTRALEELARDLVTARVGFAVSNVAGGTRFQSNMSCGPWLKQLLDLGRPSRLSQPALETLAIIAYRQPVVRSEIEAVRGVSVDHVIRALLELQLVRIVGRSELPGRPFLYGTTQLFLDHFGLAGLDDLKKMGPQLFGRPTLTKPRRRRDPAGDEHAPQPSPDDREHEEERGDEEPGESAEGN